jgi:phage-related protein
MENFTTQLQEGLKKSIDFRPSIMQLGESYKQIRINPEDRRVTWSASTGFLTATQSQTLLSKLQTWNSATKFNWIPTSEHTLPLTCICTDWSSQQVSAKKSVVNLTFEQMNVLGNIDFVFDVEISTIPTRLQQAWQFIETYTRDTLPNFANSDRLPLNDFMSKPGRRNYFPKECGTTEALYNIAYAILKMHGRFNNVAMLNYARNMINFGMGFLYRVGIPTVPTAQIWLPHWLYTGRGSSEIKGTTSVPNFLNSGVFNQLVNFTNGVGTIGVNLADVYRVHDGEILWKFVLAPLISGTNYPIDYWIDKYNNKVLANGDLVANNTSLSPGQVKLVGTHTGQLKVISSVYTGNFVAKNQPIEAFPMWRATLSGADDERNHAFDVSFWAHEVYQLLQQYDTANATQWDRAKQANLHSTLEAAKVINESYVFKIDTTTTDPQSYVGVQLILINGKSATITRLTNGWYRITQLSQPANQYGAAELQNFAIYAIWGRQTFWDCNFKSNINVILFFAVSTSQNPVDTTQTYFCPYLATANTTFNKQFNNSDFIKWGTRTHWHTTNADTAIATYQGNGGSATSGFAMETIEGRERLVSRLVLNNGAGFAGGVLALLENRPFFPITFFSRTVGSIRVVVTDANNNKFSGVWVYPQWGEATLNPSDLTAVVPSNTLDLNNPITGIEFQTTGTGEIFIWYVGRHGETLPFNSLVYKHLISNRLASASTWEVGNCEVKNSSLNDLPYNPAVVPFTANYVGTSKVSWTGSPLTGYQLGEPLYHQIRRTDLAKQIVAFKLASQDSYSKDSPTGDNGYFRATFNWARWDAQSSPPYNQFIDSSPDPNFAWEGYTHRAIESIARYWYLSGDTQAGLVVMRYMRSLYKWVSNWLLTNPSYRPPTDYLAPSQGLPQSTYHTQHGAGYLLRTAIYANLAGGEPFITCSHIQWNWKYLEAEFVSSGNMTGAWCLSQPAFTFNSQQYREYFPFWHGEIILAYLLLEEKFNELKLPN